MAGNVLDQLNKLYSQTGIMSGRSSKYAGLTDMLLSMFAAGKGPLGSEDYFRQLYYPQASQINQAQQEAIRKVIQQMSRSGINSSTLFQKMYRDAALQGAKAKNQVYAQAKAAQTRGKEAEMQTAARTASYLQGEYMRDLINSLLGGGKLKLDWDKFRYTVNKNSLWSQLLGSTLGAGVGLAFKSLSKGL